MDTNGRVKRQRVGPPPSLQLADLPDHLLAGAASYLPKPSRVMLAMACSNNLQPTATSRAIISASELDELDFGEIAGFDGLAQYLDDDDIHDILTFVVSMGGVIKRLKLTGCAGIAGSGLESLRGSVSLEHIDLEGAEHVDEEAVIPILESIIDAAPGANYRHSQFHIHVPAVWRIPMGHSNPDIGRFYLKYKGTCGYHRCRTIYGSAIDAYPLAMPFNTETCSKCQKAWHVAKANMYARQGSRYRG